MSVADHSECEKRYAELLQVVAALRAEILTWSRSRGLFAGISLQGATLREDEKANRDIYGQPIKNTEIVLKATPAPGPANKLLDLLNKYSSRKGA